MANSLFDKGREGFLDGSIDWDTDTIKVGMADGGVYTPNLSTHDFHDDIGSTARVTNFSGTNQTLGSKTVTAGVADAADVSFTGLSGAPTFEYHYAFKDTGGADSTNRLIFLIDTATGLATPAGVSTINVAYDSGSNRIFKL